MHNLRHFEDRRRQQFPATDAAPVNEVQNPNSGIKSFDTVFSSCRHHPRLGELLSAPRFWALMMAATLWTMTGCATAHATLNILVPTTAAAGTPFTITVTVMYQGKPDAAVNSVIQFASSDSAAVLPGNYPFISADAGSHTWVNGVTLMTPGNQTITASFLKEAGINGTATVVVSP